MISLTVITRLKAGLIHLGTSAMIALVVWVLLLSAWYPGDLAKTHSVIRLLVVMICAHLALGPVITTLVWNPSKGRWLHFDLVVIATLQAAAFFYGLQTLYSGRPVYIVFNVDRFDVVVLQDVDAASLGRAKAKFQPSFWKPLTVAARLPTDPTRRSELLFSSLSGGADLPQLPEYFVDVNDERSTMLARSHSVAELRKVNQLSDDKWHSLLDDFGREESELAYIPLLAKAGDGAVILDAKSGDILGILLLTPRFGPSEMDPVKNEDAAAKNMDSVKPAV